MGYRNLNECIRDLERTKQLVRINEEIDARLDAAEIQRRVYQAGGPAILYCNVKNCRFPMVSNLFGTIERTRFLFRDSLERVARMVELKVDPATFWKSPARYAGAPRTTWFLILPEFDLAVPFLGEWTFPGVRVYREGARHGLAQSLRMLAVMLTGMTVCLSTSPEKLMAALIRIRLPMAVGFMTISALRFLPMLLEEIAWVRQARRLRKSRREKRVGWHGWS